MMNKGFELIEAHYLFDYSLDKIEVVIHPQSYVHAIIQTHDLAYYSQMSIPDMRLPIQNSLTYPEIWENPFLKDSKNNLLNYPDLNFSKVDYKKYPLLELVYQVAERGDSYPIILNAANDIAVYAFLEKKINFLDIYPMIEKILLQYSPIKVNHEDDILNLDLEIRNKMTTDLLS